MDEAKIKIFGSSKDGKVRYFMNPRDGVVMGFTLSELASVNNLLSLADLNFWKTHWGSEGKAGVVVQWDEVKNHLIQLSSPGIGGIYNPYNLRGRGAWKDPDSKKFIVHTGDRLLIDGKSVSICDHVDGRYIYQRAETVYTNPEGLSIEDMEYMNWCFTSFFPFELDCFSVLFKGYLLTSILAGTLTMRPHLWITGEAGTGKTTAIKLMHVLLENFCVKVDGSTTAPGLRQMIDKDALPVIFDEIETTGKQDQANVERVIETIRAMSYGANVFKGTSNGEAREYQMHSSCLLASINVNLKHEQDRQRFVKLYLKSLSTADYGLRTANYSIFEDVLQTFKETRISERLLATAFNRIDTFHENIKVFSKIFGNKLKNQRRGLAYGTLVAGAVTLDANEVYSEMAAEKFINRYTWNDEIVQTDIECNVKAHNKLLDILLHHVVEYTNNRDVRERVTVYRLIHTIGTNPYQAETAEEALAKLGLGIAIVEGEVLLKVPNSHSELTKLFSADGVNDWKDLLKNCEGARVCQFRYNPVAARIIGKDRNYGIEIPIKLVKGE